MKGNYRYTSVVDSYTQDEIGHTYVFLCNFSYSIYSIGWKGGGKGVGERSTEYNIAEISNNRKVLRQNKRILQKAFYNYLI